MQAEARNCGLLDRLEPQFLRQLPRSTTHDPVVVPGGDDPGGRAGRRLYRRSSSRPSRGARDNPALVRTGIASAEMLKYASNAFLALKVSFVNEIANICELTGADVTLVAHALGLDQRIGARFLEAGVGWGGSCFGKDVGELIAVASDHGYDAKILRATAM